MSKTINPTELNAPSVNQKELTTNLQRENSKKGMPLSDIFSKDTIAPCLKDNSFSDLASTQSVNQAKSTTDVNTFCNEFSSFMNEVMEASEESGLSVRDVFTEVERLFYRDQREQLEVSSRMTREQTRKTLSKKSKLTKERAEKLQQSLERVKKTQFWSRFANIVTFLQLAATRLGSGSASLSNPVGVVLTLITLGEAVDSLFEDRAKKFLLGVASALFPALEDQKNQEKTLQYAKLGIGLSSIISTYQLTDIGSWFRKISNYWINNPSFPEIRLRKIFSSDEGLKINIEEYSTSLWDKQGKIYRLLMNTGLEHYKHLPFTTEAASKGMQTYHELKQNREKAEFLESDQAKKQNDKKLKSNLDSLKKIVEQEEKLFGSLRSMREIKDSLIRQLTNFK